MKKRRFWIICMIPTINIIIMTVFQYIENMYTDGEYNWWPDFLLLIIILIFDTLHYVLALTTPILLYKCKNEFNFRSCLFSVLSVLVANIIMFFGPGGGYWQVSFQDISQYMMRPICVTMATVIIISILILVKQSRRTKV